MKSKKIRLYYIQDLKELSSICSHESFHVDAVSDGRKIDLSSILGALSVDLTQPIEIVYSGEDSKLESFLEVHKV